MSARASCQEPAVMAFFLGFFSGTAAGAVTRGIYDARSRERYPPYGRRAQPPAAPPSNALEVRLPVRHELLDGRPLVDPLIQHPPDERRQLRVTREAEADQLARRQLPDPPPQLRRQELFQPDPHLEPDDPILIAGRELPHVIEDVEKREGHHHGPGGVERQPGPEQVDDGPDEIHSQNAGYEDMKPGDVPGVRPVDLPTLGHRSLRRKGASPSRVALLQTLRGSFWVPRRTLSISLSCAT